VTTTGFPAATITETGVLRPDCSFPVPLTAPRPLRVPRRTEAPLRQHLGHQRVGKHGDPVLTITVVKAAAPKITTGNTAFFTQNSATGSIAVTATGEPTPTITEVGAMRRV